MVARPIGTRSTELRSFLTRIVEEVAESEFRLLFGLGDVTDVAPEVFVGVQGWFSTQWIVLEDSD
mgnify:CR=1 FL=1